ncbi:hypothetical protein ABW19_dt0202129 [Dactylella cylindrospora]|nr:hypothetical protein ABW19_dt0202129 [Dactylella cylindrospora]
MPHHAVLKEIAAASTRPRRPTSKASSSSTVVTYSTPRQTKYPQWTRLPYLILLEIFRYASTDYPTHLSAPTNIDHAWLYTTALTCKSFSEPALNLLYESPPVTPLFRYRKFTDTLAANPELGKKIRRIVAPSAEVLETRLVKLELENLIRLTPNIRDINISTQPWGVLTYFTPSGRTPDLPPGVLTAMKEMDVELKSWTWNGGLCWLIASHYDPRHETPKKMPRDMRGFGWMDVVHGELNSFKTLTTLTLEAFDTPSRAEWIEAGEDGELLGGEPEMLDVATIAGAIGRLKYLKDLRLKDCNFVTGYFLRQIAGVHHLKRLVLEDLNTCSGNDLAQFLRMGGKHLEELEVVHCQRVMEFLSVLETATPNLKSLLFEDVPGVLSDAALDLLEIPTPAWPATLESLVMRSLGNWRAVDCDRFLRSLVNTAHEGGFKSLREVDVWCILPELGWRDRATSRRYWGDEFAKAFLDRRCNAWKEFVQKKKSEGEEVKDDKDVSLGLCQKVMFRLDDSRPSGTQLNEADFLDLVNPQSRGTTRSRPAKRQAPKASSSSRRSKVASKSKVTKKTGKTASPAKRKRGGTESFIVGRKRPRYNSEEDEDFKVDELAYEDEDGNDSSWSYDED